MVRPVAPNPSWTSMLSSVFSKAALDRSRATMISAILVAFYGGIAIVSYNAFGDTMVDLVENMPPALASLYGTNDGTPVGMAIGAIYSIIAPAVVLAYAIGGGTGAAIGEESKGSLDLLLANPLSRTSVTLSKAAVVAIGVILIAVGTWLGILVATQFVGDGIGDRDMLALTVMLIGLGWMFGSFAMAISGWTGKSILGTGIAAGVAVVSWLMTTVLAVDETFATISQYTPWHLYDGNDPIANGIDWLSLGVMVGATAILTYVALVGVNRRDLKG